MSLRCRILNGICRMLYRSEYRKFTAPCNVGRVQQDYLQRLLQKNADTEYGRKYGFSGIRSYADFAELVPLTTYEDYEPYIAEMAAGKEHILTWEKIRLFELTSGSSGGKKLIPYTDSLKAEFQHGIRPWLYDIFTHISGVCDGKSYWSITPVTAGKSFTEAGIPVGFEEDAEYFGRIEQHIMRMIFAVDGSVKFPENMEDFYFSTAKQLLTCGTLSLISVWNPTFLTILCDFIRDNAEKLSHILPEKQRTEFLANARAERFDRIFPDLKIISCWADGSAADHVREVHRRFPDVHIQPKGLLATECFISFPLCGEEGSRLSIRSHFFEFRSLADGKITTADKLDKGMYEVIVTTGGGFYRYCIGDVVEVLETCSDHSPRIRFLRRNGVFSDLFGEKLSEEFVRSVLDALDIAGKFCLLAPEGNRYCLYTTAGNITADALDSALSESYHYAYCRRLGQLQSAEVMQITGNPAKDFLRRHTAEGMRLGDIKPAVLSRRSGWDEWFTLI